MNRKKPGYALPKNKAAAVSTAAHCARLPAPNNFIPPIFSDVGNSADFNAGAVWQNPPCTAGAKNDKIFLEVTTNALALIEAHDPRCYANLQKELGFIIYSSSVAYGAYTSVFQCCTVNFDRISFEWESRDAPDYAAHYEWYLARYAALLVHEATHGRLDRLGFSYNKYTRVQIERICVCAERRFAAHLPQTHYNFARDLVTPFDPARWEPYWNAPYRQCVSEALQRIKQTNHRVKMRDGKNTS